MSRSSGERFETADRAAVEPIAALVAVLAVGAALGLYVGALDDVGPDVSDGSDGSDRMVDRIERDVTVGGVVRPNRLNGLPETRTPTTVELEADGGNWRIGLGGGGTTGTDRTDRQSAWVEERRVTVRVGPGENAAGTLRVVVHE